MFRGISFLSESDIAKVCLAPLVIYSRYRGFPGIGPVDYEEIFRQELAGAVRTGGVCAGLFAGGAPLAVCAMMPLAWDGEHFALPMDRLFLASAKRCSVKELASLVEQVIERASKDRPLSHLSAEIDIDDYLCVNAMLALGAELLDVKRQFRWTSLRGVQAPKFLSRVRSYGHRDASRVLELAESTRFESRFSRDTMLPEERVSALYVSWFERLLERAFTPEVIALVFERNGQVEACGVIERNKTQPLASLMPFMDKGLYVSSSKGIGGYYPVIYRLAQRSLSVCPVVQTTVSLNNYAAIRVLEKMGAGTQSRQYALRLRVR